MDKNSANKAACAGWKLEQLVGCKVFAARRAEDISLEQNVGSTENPALFREAGCDIKAKHGLRPSAHTARMIGASIWRMVSRSRLAICM